MKIAIEMVDQARPGRWAEMATRKAATAGRRANDLHRPADDPAVVGVQDRDQIEPALLGLDVGDVGEPDLIPARRR